MELKHYPQLTVEKITGEHTKFYPYKLNWIISQIPLNQDQKDTVIQDLTNYFNNYQDDLITTANIYNQLINVLTNHNYYKAKEQVKDYHQKIQHEFKQATNPVHKIDQLREGDKNITNENANKDSRVYSTQRDLLAGSASRAIGLSMLPPLVAKAHQRGDIHWHDLDYSPFTTETNCCLPNFRDMLQNGFKLGNAWVSSPKSIEVAVTLISEIITSIAGSQYGGQSCNRLDEVLAPYAKLNYDKHLKEAEDWVEPDKQENFAKKRTIHDITNAMQSLEYNINMMMSTQGQTPFVTVNFGLGTSWIEREIQKAILNVRIKGLGRERRTAVFPKLVFTLKKGINLNPSDPNYDIKQLAIKCSTRRIYPDILNYDNIVKITGSFKSPMGCRSFLQGWINPETGKDEEDGRMNLGVVTVNLPRIALEAHGDQDLFWEIFNERMAICHQALKYRIARCKQAKPENAPTLFEYGAFGRLKPDEDVDKLFRNSRATVSLGYIGLYEVNTTFYGPNWEHNPKAHAFAELITKRMHDLCAKWEDEEGYHYSLYSTPAEKLTDTFAQDDIAKFGKIKDITDKEYYTNSFHYDVRKKPTPFEKLTFEKDFPKYATGGFIHYAEYPNMRQNPKALEAVWDWSYNENIGYMGTNTPIDRCYKCGFKGEFKATARGFVCPQCGNHDPAKADVVKRVCGYLGNPSVRGWNHGRNLELMSRKKNVDSQLETNLANFEKAKLANDSRTDILDQVDKTDNL